MNIIPQGNVERIRGRQWQTIKARVFNRDGWLCVPCKARSRLTPAREVDHIIPLEAGGDNALENLQAICLDCHGYKTNTESNGAAVSDIPWYLRRVEGRPVITIVGAHYSGKADKAHELATAGDTIVNVDALAITNHGRRYFSGLSTHERRRVLRARNRALKDYLDGDGNHRCINVCTAPTFKERQFWRSISDNVFVMDYDPDQCKRKAERDLVGSDDLAGVIKDIDKWE